MPDVLSLGTTKASNKRKRKLVHARTDPSDARETRRQENSALKTLNLIEPASAANQEEPSFCAILSASAAPA